MLVTQIEMQPNQPKFDVIWAHLLKFEVLTYASSQAPLSFAFTALIVAQTATSIALMASQTMQFAALPPSNAPCGRGCPTTVVGAATTTIEIAIVVSRTTTITLVRLSVVSVMIWVRPLRS